jgi:hypothetical protein
MAELEREERIHDDNGNGLMSLRELILIIREWNKYILSKWIVILVVGIIGGLIGLFYAISQKTIYNAELTFALEDASGGSVGLGGALGIASQFGVDLGGGSNGAFSGDNLIELMKSRSLIEKTLLSSVVVKGKRTTLAEVYIDFNDLRETWIGNSDLKGIKFSPDLDRSLFTLKHDSILGNIYRNIVAKNIAVERKDKKLSIISVFVKSTSEVFSKRFSEILVKEVSDFYVETKTKKSAENLSILQYQTDSVRGALNRAISGVANSMDANPNPNSARQILMAPSQRRTVDVEANRAILTELVKNLEMSKITLRKETPLIQIIDTPILPLQKEEFGKKIGVIIGGMIGGLIAVLFLIMKKFLSDLNL